jgi:polysaccharide deacetylase family protein (PEP-CTERM system associated)
MNAVGGKPMHCLSFDVEEYFQVSAFESPLIRSKWGQFESRICKSIDKILELLGQRDVRATFFVLGWVAERYPHIVRSIASEGHEIASHGYGHELLMDQTPMAFREDIRKAKQIIEDIVGQGVYGYRAPSFSITKDTLWALPILVEEGYLYDSSVFPIVHDRYGLPNANPLIHQLRTDAGYLCEVPPSTIDIFGVRLPVAGGGYFRLFPYSILQNLLRRIESMGHPLVMYLHPWEFDPDQPRMQGAITSRVRHYINLQKTERRFCLLMNDFPFAPINEAIEPVRRLMQNRDSSGPRSDAFEKVK